MAQSASREHPPAQGSATLSAGVGGLAGAAGAPESVTPPECDERAQRVLTPAQYDAWALAERGMSQREIALPPGHRPLERPLPAGSGPG